MPTSWHNFISASLGDINIDEVRQIRPIGEKAHTNTFSLQTLVLSHIKPQKYNTPSE